MAFKPGPQIFERDHHVLLSEAASLRGQLRGFGSQLRRIMKRAQTREQIARIIRRLLKNF